MKSALCFVALLFFGAWHVTSQEFTIDNINDFKCGWVDNNRTCPDLFNEIRFYLYTRLNVNESQLIHIDSTLSASNLTRSNFNARHSSKIIIHGFRSDMFLTPLYEMKNEYLAETSMNIFFVDWFNLSSSMCYPAVVHNIKHVGECTGQLVSRIRDAGSDDIHIIGFSLGAQVINYIAESLKPSFKLKHVTGLDPALPLFINVDKTNKLDASDALFVDVHHCNSFIQSKFERCGHVDFYFNNAVFQPGCGSSIACSHHRCADYFMESIRSHVGFYGRKCKTYLHYIFGLCQNESPNTLAGEHCDVSTRGTYFISTNSKYPYARGHMRSSRMDEIEIGILIKNLGEICNELDEDVYDDEVFVTWKSRNCKKLEKKVVMKIN